jgi:hypothetical protein
MAGEIRKGAGSRLGDLTDDVRGRVDEAVRGARKRLS